MNIEEPVDSIIQSSVLASIAGIIVPTILHSESSILYYHYKELFYLNLDARQVPSWHCVASLTISALADLNVCLSRTARNFPTAPNLSFAP